MCSRFTEFDFEVRLSTEITNGWLNSYAAGDKELD